MTVNETIVLMKAVRERLGELRSLLSQVSTRTTFYGERERVVEPKYDLKVVDKKIVELETWLFKADSAIKQCNAVTQVNVGSDLTVDDLLKSLD